MKLVTIVGNRPQFIKSAPLSMALRDAGIDEIVVHTGQHWDDALSGIFFDELAIAAPAYRLDLRTADAETLRGPIASVLDNEHPDAVLVYGDTNSTAAGARAAVAADTPVAHVEAGLRSGDLEMPEERNRIEVDRISSVLFAPDESSAATLRSEGVPGDVHVTGDVMADATRLFTPLARERSTIVAELGLEPGRYVVATVHREANVRPERLARIIAGLAASARPVIFPAHPRTRGALASAGIGIPDSVRLMEPLGYLDFAALVSGAAVIATDSGGLQKEAYWHGIPCVTMRPSTEWTGTVTTGANVLVDDDPDRIAAALEAASMPEELPLLYGDGHASERVATVLAATIAHRAF